MGGGTSCSSAGGLISTLLSSSPICSDLMLSLTFSLISSTFASSLFNDLLGICLSSAISRTCTRMSLCLLPLLISSGLSYGGLPDFASSRESSSTDGAYSVSAWIICCGGIGGLRCYNSMDIGVLFDDSFDCSTIMYRAFALMPF